MPEWAHRKRPREGSYGGKGSASSKGAAEAEGGKGGKSATKLEDLTKAVAMLALSTSSDCRELQALMMTTFLVPASWAMVKRGLQAGQLFQQMVQQRQQCCLCLALSSAAT